MAAVSAPATGEVGAAETIEAGVCSFFSLVFLF